MSDFICQICGAQPDVKTGLCINCGSKVSFEAGNPHTGKPIFQRKLVSIAAGSLAFVLLFNGFVLANASSQIGALAWAQFGIPLGSSEVPNTGPVGGDENEGDAVDGGPVEEPDEEQVNDEDFLNTYSLTTEEREDGFKEFESSGIAWRWATPQERESLYCDPNYNSSCTWIKVIALRDCVSVLINADISTDSSSNTAEETVVGYGNNNIDDSGMRAGSLGTIELGAQGYYPNGSWTFMTYANCGQNVIGHD